MLLVYIATSAESVSLPRETLFVPPIALRPSDLSTYAHRFARIAADRGGNPHLQAFSKDAISLLLSYDWPENYRQLQEIILQLNKPASSVIPFLDSFKDHDAVAMESIIARNANEPMRDLLQRQQTRYLKQMALEQGLSDLEIAQKYGFEIPNSDAIVLGDLDLARTVAP